MENAKINYIEIIKGLQSQFDAVLEDVKDYLEGIEEPTREEQETYEELKTVKSVFVADEQYFVKNNDFNPNNVYIAVKFGSATVNFASSVLSLTLRIMATENKIKPTQLILGEFVTAYNIKPLNNNETITQVWQTPTVSSNFNPTNKAFRTLFAMTGVVVVGQNTVDIASLTYITDIEDSSTESGYVEEEVALMSFDEGYQVSNNPQPFGNTLGFAVSEINFGTNALTFSTYLLDSQLVADCMSARGLKKIEGIGEYSSTKSQNDVFKFRITYTNGFSNKDSSISILQEYKLISYKIGKRIGDIPSFLASFSY